MTGAAQCVRLILDSSSVCQIGDAVEAMKEVGVRVVDEGGRVARDLPNVSAMPLSVPVNT